MSHCLTITPAPSQEVADLLYLAYRKTDHAPEWRGRIECAALKLNRLESDTMLVAAELKNLRNELTSVTNERDGLKAQLSNITPAPSPDHVLDDADVAVVKAEQVTQGLNADGTAVAPPVTEPAPPAVT